MINQWKVLYIDDEMVNLELFKIHFSKKFQVETTLSGSEGLRLLENDDNIEVVISDMKMPIMNGLEFINKAKSLYPDKKYFILTGYDISQEIKDALAQNLIAKYFQKPYNVAQLSSVINEIINKTN